MAVQVHVFWRSGCGGRPEEGDEVFRLHNFKIKLALAGFYNLTNSNFNE